MHVSNAHLCEVGNFDYWIRNRGTERDYVHDSSVSCTVYSHLHLCKVESDWITFDWWSFWLDSILQPLSKGVSYYTRCKTVGNQDLKPRSLKVFRCLTLIDFSWRWGPKWFAQGHRGILWQRLDLNSDLAVPGQFLNHKTQTEGLILHSVTQVLCQSNSTEVNILP